MIIIVPFLCSLSSVPRSELSDYLILERPSAASWKYMSEYPLVKG